MVADPHSWRTLSHIFQAAQQAVDEKTFLSLVCGELLRWTHAAAVLWMENVHGDWWRVAGQPAEIGRNVPPEEPLHEAADRGGVAQSEDWRFLPVGQSTSGEILAIRGRRLTISDEQLTEVVEPLGVGLGLFRQRRRAELWPQFKPMFTIASSPATLGNKSSLDKALQDWTRRAGQFWSSELVTIQLAPSSPRENWLPVVESQPDLISPGDLQQLRVRLRETGVLRWQAPASGGTAPTTNPPGSRSMRNFLAAGVELLRGQMFGLILLAREGFPPFTAGDASTLSDLARESADFLGAVASSALRGLTEPRTGVGGDLVGQCPAMLEVKRRIQRIAPTELPILILGENGTGKEVVSRAIHLHSRRHRKPFLAVNCAAITETLLESELFGYEKGAFTDARETKAGKFETAHGGTLFLDEIGELTPRAQAKLLRVLEDKQVVRVGGHEPIPVDTRILAATNRDLGEMVRQKTFREDLFFRLNPVIIELPPLRDRGQDIVLLAETLLRELAERAQVQAPVLSPAAKKALLHYSWPGNVRELRNVMERCLYLHPGEMLDVTHLGLNAESQVVPFSIGQDQTLAAATRQFQIAFIERQIRECDGNMTEVAHRLGLHRTNLYRKMKQLGFTEET